MSDSPLTYEVAGVSISAQDEAIAKFRDAVNSTHGPEVLGGIGAFGAAFAPRLEGIGEPVLVSSTDSVGTKTILHSRFGTLEWAGRDIVGCVVNDIIVSGARPLFFLDYLGINKVVPDDLATIVKGVAAACADIGCPLIGGEIAEMSDIYKPGDFDLAGFAIGIADRPAMLGPERVSAGDQLIGLKSTGVHCNGFTLARKALAETPEAEWTALNEQLGTSLRDSLLAPTRCYANEMRALTEQFNIAAAAHISGGGLVDNLPRIMPPKLAACVDRNKIEVPPVFDIIQRRGHIDEAEMWHVFNMGVGFVVVVKPADASHVLSFCNKHEYHALLIGEVAAVENGQFQWCE